LLGTGAGIAFFMVRAHRTGDAAAIAQTADSVVIADLLFTATAVVLQPITGTALVLVAGYDWRSAWIVSALALYAIAGMFWLPGLWLELRMRNVARKAVGSGSALPALYYRLYWTWFACGFPAFTSVIAIYWVMTAKPGTF